MSPHPHPSLRHFAGLVVLLGAGTVSLAQIGSSSSDLIARYGTPLMESTNDAGVQTLTYRKDGFDITAYGREGVALRVVYQKDKLTDQDVDRLLTANRGNAAWAVWTPPGIPDPENPSTLWLRSDEMAMAVLKGNEFSVTAGAWNQQPSAASTPPPPPAVQAAPAPAREPPPPPPVVRKRPPAPALLPAPGDTRAKAIQMLGQPRGGGVSGGKEILQYDWGQVYLEQGMVIRVD